MYKEFDEQELRKRLTEIEYEVTQNSATEPAYSGKWEKNKASGMYTCIVCGVDLFDSETKFDSGTGWPSFYDVASSENIELAMDRSIIFMPRTEVKCANCGAHLGHVFNDGPQPTGQRYCMNSAALDFKGDEDAI